MKVNQIEILLLAVTSWSVWSEAMGKPLGADQ